MGGGWGGGWKELFKKFSWILGKNHQWILKPLGEKLMETIKWKAQNSCTWVHWSVLPSLKRVISSVQSLSRIQLFTTPWTTAHQASLSITNSRSSLKLISSSVVLFCSCLRSFPASGSFQMISSSYQVAKYWSFSFSISPSNEYSGMTSFRIDWLDLLAVQGSYHLKSLLQHHS